MTDGPSLSQQVLADLHDHPTLSNFAHWIDLNSPPLPMLAGMLELIGNELYRQERFKEGSDVLHVAQALRE